jgi:hypothetical protein
MLELRPSCEHCNKSLPPNSTEARICSFECTFCISCIENVLGSNACPNCGGGFVQRPIRPANNWKNGNYLGENPSSTTAKFRPVNLEDYSMLIEKINNTKPEER